MSEKRLYSYDKGNNKVLCNLNDVCDYSVTNVFQLLNSLSEENEQLRQEKDYWKSKAMTLLMQIRRLTSRMTDEEVKEFSKELEDGGDGV